MSEYVTLLRTNSDYRLLWLGSVVSQLGDWFNLIGSASLVANLSGAGTAISYLFLARFLPLFLFSPAYSSENDHLFRLMAITQTG